MSEHINIVAEPRERAGKGTSRAVRRTGRVPGVIYGDKQPPVMVTVEKKALQMNLKHHTFFTHTCTVQIGKDKTKAIPRDVQFHPVTDEPMHIDFLRVSASTVLTVAVPVEFINEDKCLGLQQGGILNIVHHEIHLHCKAEEIPDALVVDLAGLEIGDIIHSDAVKLPAGATFAEHEKVFTVATIAAPSVMTEEEEKPAEEAPAEGAVAAAAPAAGAAPAPAEKKPAEKK